MEHNFNTEDTNNDFIENTNSINTIASKSKIYIELIIKFKVK